VEGKNSPARLAGLLWSLQDEPFRCQTSDCPYLCNEPWLYLTSRSQKLKFLLEACLVSLILGFSAHDERPAAATITTTDHSVTVSCSPSSIFSNQPVSERKR